MSRRHHGGRPHRPNSHARNPLAPTAVPPTEAPRPAVPDAPTTEAAIRLEQPVPAAAPAPATAPAQAPATAPAQAPAVPPARADVPGAPAAPIGPPAPSAGPMSYSPRPVDSRRAGPDGETLTGSAGCTAPQLRRFIKSRPYVPMHELRRRFGINGQEDDVTPVDLAGVRPARAGSSGSCFAAGRSVTSCLSTRAHRSSSGSTR
jgi:hypothetical protein